MQIRKWVGQPIGLVNPCDGLTNPWTQLEKSAYCSPSPFCDALLRAIWPRWPHRRRGRRLRSPGDGHQPRRAHCQDGAEAGYADGRGIALKVADRGA